MTRSTLASNRISFLLIVALILGLSPHRAEALGQAEFYDSSGTGGIERFGQYANWRVSWDIIVPGYFGGNQYEDLFFYDRQRGDGEFYTCDGRGAIQLLRRYPDIGTSWHQIVPGNFDGNHMHTDLLFYDQKAGVGEFYATDGSGGRTLFRRYTNWRKTWDLIVPGNFKVLEDEFSTGPYTDLLFYDRETGHAEIYATDGHAGLVFLKSFNNWRKSWTMIVPGNFGRGESYYTDLLLYDRMHGTGEFYATDGSGGLRFLKRYDNWRRTWSRIIPGNFGGTDYTDLLFYDGSTGAGHFHTTDGTGTLTRLRFYNNWRRTWQAIVPGYFGVVGSTDQHSDLLFYDRHLRFIPDFSQVTASPFENITESGIVNPVLTAGDVDDLVGASFVADPFLFYENDMWYLFFEVARWDEPIYRGHHFGRIGLATSYNGIDWDYDGIVIDEPVHKSYPLVIKADGRHYMFAESADADEIRFYRAERFPYDWRVVYTIKKCVDGVRPPSPGQCINTGGLPLGDLDPSIFRYNGKWWMFTGSGPDNSVAYVYYSDHLLSGWTSHPENPIAEDNTKARPGGRSFVFDHDRIIRIAQHDRPGRYGRKVRAYEVTTLTETEYEESPDEIVGGAAFCMDGGVFCDSDTTDMCANDCSSRPDIWNLCGMHNFDAWWTGDHWLIATDGYKCLAHPDDWSIGIFVSGPR